MLRRVPLGGVLQRGHALGRGYGFVGLEGEDGLFDHAALGSGLADYLVHAFIDANESFHARIDLAPVRIAADF